MRAKSSKQHCPALSILLTFTSNYFVCLKQTRIYPNSKYFHGSCSACMYWYLSSCHRTASACGLDDPHTFYCDNYSTSCLEASAPAQEFPVIKCFRGFCQILAN